MFERFTDRARKVMALANQEAQRFNHEYIGTEHILLGLVKEGSGVGAQVLKNSDVDLAKVRVEVSKLVKSGTDRVFDGKLPQTPRAKKVIEKAVEEARSLKHSYVGTEHLLLGLIDEEDGVAAQVLIHLGLSRQKIRDEVLELAPEKQHRGDVILPDPDFDEKLREIGPPPLTPSHSSAVEQFMELPRHSSYYTYTNPRHAFTWRDATWLLLGLIAGWILCWFILRT